MDLNDMVDGTSWERIVCLEKEKNMDRRRKSRREQYASKKTFLNKRPTELHEQRNSQLNFKSQLDLHEVDLHEVVVESGYEVETLQSSVRLCTGLEIEVEHTKQKQRGRIVDYENRFKDYGVMSTGSASSREHSGRLHGNLQCIPTAAHILQIPNICPYCNAKKFQYESKGFCCADGKITLHSNDVPEDLYNLFTSSSEESLEFKKYIRTYNSNFAFTSFGVTYDKDLCKRNKGIYTFRIVGQVYHYINQILPLDSRPSYLQLYFYDTENELQYRLNISEKVRESILQRLMDILHVNPYAKFFRSLSGDPNLETYTLQIKSTPELDQRVFNAPSDSQVAIVWPEEDPSANLRIRDILVYCHSGTPYRVKYFFGCYDPLQYPLLFPFGECGWHEGIQRSNDTSNQFCGTNALIDANLAPSATELIRNETLVHEKKKRRSHVSCREYYCYKLQVRPLNRSILLHAGRLLQQYVVDMYVKIETSRLDYFRNNQSEIRAELYQGIVDSIESGESRGNKIGRNIILPTTFIGSPRDMKKRYMDAMALVQRFGKPDIFLTITCNPNWLEINQELEHNDEIQNRPDLITRIFRAKLEELKKDLFKKQIFGPVATRIHVIEFQKRGLPHAHFLIILKQSAKILTVDSIDKIVSAEIPDPDVYPHLHFVVVKHMMHGPCGVLNPTNISMKQKNKCRSNFPKEFIEETSLSENSYPRYRRRNDNRKVKVRGHWLDNRWVVPYNPYLSAKFDCHINVEICSTIKAVKYLYKYVYKGHDRVSICINPDENTSHIDEIKSYQSARWISPPEATWRIFGFILYELFPSVVALQLHLEDNQVVTYRNSDDLERVVQREFNHKTMLTQFFSLNINDSKAKTLLYREIPRYFVWDTNDRIWVPRKKGDVIGRIVAANPAEGERYYLRLLLNHVKGPTSFQDLKHVNGVIVSTFREAALFRGLLSGDNNCELCLEEASEYQMPMELRRLFATILALCAPNDPAKLWNKFKESFLEDYIKNGLSLRDAEVMALQSINSLLEPIGKNINQFGLVSYDVIVDEQKRLDEMLNEQYEIPIPESDISSLTKLNHEQQIAYNMILEKVLTNSSGMFFIDGPGGTGKTYLYRALLATLRDKNLIALATASSGVAASLLPGGRTAHSRFKIPLETNNSTTCAVSKQSALASLLRISSLIIWDEAPMVNRCALEALDKMLQDVNDCYLPFGGKVIVLGGDFRQILPVVPKGNRDDIIEASIACSYLWPYFTKLKLTQNMRARIDPSFSEYLLRIGNGTEEHHLCDMIRIPASMTISFEDEIVSLKNLINIVFPDLENYAKNLDFMINRVILAPKNETVDYINNILIEQFKGEIYTYYSFDESIDKTEQGMQEDFLNTLTPNGIPPHELILKKNCPVMLLRNINPSEGLCNGTRLVCRRFERNVIEAEIAIGEHRGKIVFLPRIPFIPLEGDKNPFPFKRTQFPIRPCFAITINKSQGQTLDYVGLYLPEPVFTHGQLYVALSRAKTGSSIKILIKPILSDKNHEHCTNNVVYDEILSLINSF